MLVLSQQEIETHYGMAEAINALRHALLQYVTGNIVNPHRIVMNFKENLNSHLTMPSAMPQTGIAAVKVVTIFPENPQHNLRTSQGVTLLSSTENGAHLALLDASYLTALRTGAISGVATDLLARKDAKTVAVTGCGGLAVQQLNAVLTVRPTIQTVYLWSRRHQQAEQFKLHFIEKFPQHSVQFIVCETVNQAVAQADIVNIATCAEKAFFAGSDLKLGAHINGVGSYLPHMQEVGEDSLSRCSKIVVDTLEGCKAEAGDLIIAANNGTWRWEDLHAEVGEILAGDKSARENDTEITFFKSVGTAYFDLAVAADVYNQAKIKGLGTEITL